jgi:hypothetical protein
MPATPQHMMAAKAPEPAQTIYGIPRLCRAVPVRLPMSYPAIRKVDKVPAPADREKRSNGPKQL